MFNQKISVGAPFYNAIFIPITIIAIAFLFFSVDSKWSRNQDLKIITSPILVSLIISIIATLLIEITFESKNWIILISILSGLLIVVRYIIEIINYFFFKKYVNPFSVLAHLGLGLLLISISFNSMLSTERALNIKINENEQYRDLNIFFKDIKVIKNSNHDSIKASFLVKNSNGQIFDLSPEKRKYFARGQITTETAIQITPLKDIYMTIGDQLDDGSWVVNIQINYLIRYIWFSACLMALAGLLLVFSKRRT